MRTLLFNFRKLVLNAVLCMRFPFIHIKMLEFAWANIFFNRIVMWSWVMWMKWVVKLGIVKNFVKTIIRNGNAFGYLKSKFPKLSEMKIKEGVFLGPQIRELIQDSEFDECFGSEGRKAWLFVKNLIRNFLRNHKYKHYKRYVNEMLTQFHGLNVNYWEEISGLMEY